MVVVVSLKLKRYRYVFCTLVDRKQREMIGCGNERPSGIAISLIDTRTRL
jgi:hypothetical protein